MYQIIIDGTTLLVKATNVRITQPSARASLITVENTTGGLSFMVSRNSAIMIVPPAPAHRVPPPLPQDADAHADAHDLAHDYHRRVA